jgi:hypothetical protein
MSRKLLWIALLTAVPFTPLRAQELDQQQSLGDIARKARKAKEDQAKTTAAAKAVITEDSLPSRRTLGSASSANSATLDKSHATAADKFAEASADFDDAEQSLNQLDPLDRAELAKVALPGQSADFPGRRTWEEKLFAAKQGYVSHGRVLLSEARQLLNEIKSLSLAEKTPESKSKLQGLSLRLRQVMQDSLQTEANFQAILVEGQKLANQSASN